MKWKVEFYRKENGEEPVKEFLLSLPEKHRAKAVREIDLLEEFGTNLKEPHVKHIKGHKNLWELRIKFAGDISRIFYFMPINDTFLLLSGFVKKTEKTPQGEIDKALHYMEDYARRTK
ncbi:MAG: type II toxin-antitoxin system RelE/ParE family toxin [Deltaproteobacteria bacterium]|nr:type II toxin-antitoxin system RelE/ParE family toxin [Deltaproteobacteria bacterium]